MATLYEIKAEYLEVYNMDDVEEDVWFDTLEAIEGELEVKADAYAKLIKEYEAESAKFKAEAQRLVERQRVYENRVKRMKDRIYLTMKETGLKEIPNTLFKIKIQANGGVAPLIIKEGVKIPEEYQKVTTTIDNDKIREALKTQELDFAELGERGSHLVIK